MLAFGFKVAWFFLSLTGFLSSVAALPAFAQALGGYLIPVLYTCTNFVLQGLFCLGMVWRMDPVRMPRAFCVAQPNLLGIAWAFMTAITSSMAVCTSLAILRPAGGLPATPAYIRSVLRWHPACLLLAVIPMAAFTAYLILTLHFDAVQPVDGMACDSTNPVWVRLLSYAGVPLLLALPSFVLTCTAAYQFHARSPRPSQSFPRHNDHFTPVPLRRQSKYRLSSNSWHETKDFEPAPDADSSMPPLSNTLTRPSVDQRSTTPSGTIIVEAIPSPPDSLSSARGRTAAGRAPISPGVANMRYHLPFQWQQQLPPSRSSSDPLRGSPDQSYYRHTPSPLVFAQPGHGRHTTTVSVTPEPTQRLYDAAPWLKDEKAYMRQLDREHARRHDADTMDDNDLNDDDYDADADAISAELQWVRNSGDSAPTVKSGLEFARMPRQEAFVEEGRRSFALDASRYDAGLTEPPIPLPTPLPSDLAGAVWRMLFFQLLAAAAQIVAPATSLVDMFAQRAPPAPFGTQHVALLLVAWAPTVAFGVRLPWRRGGGAR